jgi:DNA-binding PadR family transcriptional regulator
MELIVVEGTVYRAIAEMPAFALRWRSLRSSRKYYALTDQGREVLKELEASWKLLSS